ncbi:L,D-transpeptidase family protein [Alsobacter soli]|uniref:L,D-transpeptidase family protein n=1 Tax=Alsobacter soli TaxID=2109933 RepID=UPI001FE0BEA5|nr:murein L,D-transpeptidase family protein [Alsobacter soli]
MKAIATVLGAALMLAACQDGYSNRHLAPIPPGTMALMHEKGTTPSQPILLRAFKKEAELEVWKRGADGRYALLKTFPICRWSGQLGPKVREGDRQAPEGFYTITPASMNPNSALYLSFNLGFPNDFDRANDRTGSYLMVHGSCSSRGCFAMTDDAISEVYAIAREAFAGGQREFQFQSYPFRMTAENLARHRADPNIAFWRNLKEGNDVFALTRQEPQVGVCDRRYTFNAADGGCGPQDAALSSALKVRERADDAQVARLVAAGVPAVRLVYRDGGQNAAFMSGEAKVGDVSRPEALTKPEEIIMGPSSTGSVPRAGAGARS